MVISYNAPRHVTSFCRMLLVCCIQLL